MSSDFGQATRDARGVEAGTERLSRLRLVGQALNSALSVNEALHIVLAQASSVLGGASGVLALVHDGPEGPDGVRAPALDVVAWEGLSDVQVARFGRLALDSAVPLAEAVRTAAPVYVRSAAERDERYPHLADPTNRTAASASLPLCLNGRVVGALGVGAPHDLAFDVADRLFLAALAEQCASFLGRVGYVLLYPSSGGATGPSPQDQLLDTLIQRAPVGVAYLDRDRRFVMANEAMGALVGRAPSELVGRPVAAIVPGLADHEADWDGVLQGGVPVSGLEVTAPTHRDATGDDRTGDDATGGDTARRDTTGGDGGEPGTWVVDLFPIPLATGAGHGAGITVVDITERNRLAARLREAEHREAQDRFRRAMDAMLDLVTIETPVRDEHGVIVDFVIDHMNRAQRDVAGRDADDLIGRRILDLYPAVRGSALFELYRRVVETGEPGVIEHLPYRDVIDGIPVQGFYGIQVVPHEDGILVTSRDITASLAVQHELADAHKQLATAQRLAHVGSWRLVLETGHIECSDELFRICGVEPAGGRGQSVQETMARFVHPEDLDALTAAYARALDDHQPFRVEHRIVRDDGSIRHVVAHVEVIVDETRRVTELWGATQDITGRREVEHALRDASTRLSEEHSTVETLQQIIVPQMPEVPEVALRGVYLPAERSLVGGDWYDAFTLADGSIGLVVGDVAGHGVESAAMMTQARNALRAFATLDPDPSLALTRVNDLLRPLADEVHFVTCFYGVFDPITATLHWSSGGHPPPLVRRGDDAFYLADVLGPPIGAITGVSYLTQTTALAPGDSLVLYTDGLIERRGETLDAGLNRLRHLVQALDTERDDFLATVANAMTGGSARPDDICILALTILD